MKLNRNQLRILIQEAIEEVKNTCWSGYSPGAKTGVKTKKGKGGKSVANCEEINEDDIEEQTLTDFQNDPYKYGKTAADALDPVSEPDLYRMQQVREGDLEEGLGDMLSRLRRRHKIQQAGQHEEFMNQYYINVRNDDGELVDRHEYRDYDDESAWKQATKLKKRITASRI